MACLQEIGKLFIHTSAPHQGAPRAYSEMHHQMRIVCVGKSPSINHYSPLGSEEKKVVLLILSSSCRCVQHAFSDAGDCRQKEIAPGRENDSPFVHHRP